MGFWYWYARQPRLVVQLALAVAAMILAILALTRPVPRAVVIRDYVRAAPAGIVVGPDATEFTITDEARPPAVRYVCAFLQPVYVKTNPDGVKLYAPAVQCNVAGLP